MQKGGGFNVDWGGGFNVDNSPVPLGYAQCVEVVRVKFRNLYLSLSLACL